MHYANRQFLYCILYLSIVLLYLITDGLLLNIVYNVNVHNKESMKMAESISSNNSFSAAINNAVANQGKENAAAASTTTTSTTSSTAITPAQEKELKALGLNTNPNIKTTSDAKSAIAKAQKVATEKAADMSGKPDGDSDDIKDTVQISNTAQKLSGSSATE